MTSDVHHKSTPRSGSPLYLERDKNLRHRDILLVATTATAVVVVAGARALLSLLLIQNPINVVIVDVDVPPQLSLEVVLRNSWVPTQAERSPRC